MAQINFLNKIFSIIYNQSIYLIFTSIFAIILLMVIINYHLFFYGLHILVVEEIIRINYQLI